MDKSRFGSVAASLILIAMLAGGATADELRGQVSKQGTRVARPQDGVLDANLSGRSAANAPMSAAVNDGHFVLGANVLKSNVSVDGWNPFEGQAQQTRLTPSTSILQTAVQATQVPANVDYDAIERGYATAVSAAPPAKPASSGSGAGGIPVDLAHAAFVGQAMSQSANAKVNSGGSFMGQGTCLPRRGPITATVRPVSNGPAPAGLPRMVSGPVRR